MQLCETKNFSYGFFFNCLLVHIFRDALYGWCTKCKTNHPEEYKKIIGYVNKSIISKEKTK